MKVEISVKLKMKDVEVTLGIEELKELKKVIDSIVEKEYVHSYPYYVPSYPTGPYWSVSSGTLVVGDNPPISSYTICSSDQEVKQ